MSTPTPLTTEEVADIIYAATDRVPADEALEALSGCIIGVTSRCEAPYLALLGVINDLTDRLRFGGDENEKALDPHVWRVFAWKEAK